MPQTRPGRHGKPVHDLALDVEFRKRRQRPADGGDDRGHRGVDVDDVAEVAQIGAGETRDEQADS